MDVLLCGKNSNTAGTLGFAQRMMRFCHSICTPIGLSCQVSVPQFAYSLRPLRTLRFKVRKHYRKGRKARNAKPAKENQTFAEN